MRLGVKVWCCGGVLLTAVGLGAGGGNAAPPAHPNNSVRITFPALDYGEATLVQTPGGATVLLGAGSAKDGPKLVHWLKSNGIKQINLAVVQTWKETHTGGLSALLRALPVSQMMTNPSPGPTGQMSLVTKQVTPHVAAKKLEMASPGPGESHVFSYHPFCQVTAVGPTGPMLTQFKGDPNCSLALEFELERLSFLALGDVSRKQQETLWSTLRDKPWGHVLRVGRNGAADTVPTGWLKALKTRVAVIPVARRGRSKPAPATLQALQKAGVRVYRTDTQGTVKVIMANGEIQVKTGG